MSNVVSIRRDETVADLWETYRALAAAVLDEPRLSADHQHNIRMVRAHRRWADALIAQDRQG